MLLTIIANCGLGGAYITYIIVSIVQRNFTACVGRRAVLTSLHS
jgi:hypothetical protein